MHSYSPDDILFICAREESIVLDLSQLRDTKRFQHRNLQHFDSCNCIIAKELQRRTAIAEIQNNNTIDVKVVISGELLEEEQYRTRSLDWTCYSQRFKGPCLPTPKSGTTGARCVEPRLTGSSADCTQTNVEPMTPLNAM